MKKYIKRFLSVMLSMILMLSLCVPAFGADTTSNEYQFFSLLDKSATGLTSACNTGTSTGNWTAAKEQLLSYYKTKFAGISWIKSQGAGSLAVTSLYDTLLFADSERYIAKQTVTTTMQQISIPLSAGNVRSDYILAALEHSDTSGIMMYPRERGTTYEPKLSVTFTDNTTQEFSASADAYIRATGKNQSYSYGATAWGTSNPNELWAMHRSDTTNQMPYSNDEMRTYIKFNYSLPSGKSVKSGSIKIYAQVKNPNSGTPASGAELELMAFSPCLSSWTESTLTWNYVAGKNSFAFYSWDGLGGIIYNETLYGEKFANLSVPVEFIQYTSRFYEETSLASAGYYEKAKDMLLRFAEQTYDTIKNGTTTSGGYPKVHPIGTANRNLAFPYIYKKLLDNNALTAEENYKLLRWYYQDIQYSYKEKSGNVFVNGGSTPNTVTNTIMDNHGPWYITGFYNTFAFFPEFSESSSWRSMFEARLAHMANVFLNNDGSYVEVTFGYPSAVLSWYSNMLGYMAEAGYTSSTVETLKQSLINLVKYMVDCSYPNGYMPKYGDGGSVYVKNTVNQLFSIKGITSNTSENLQNLLWYKTNGEQGTAPVTKAFYPDAKIAVDRTGWTANDSMLFMNAKGGGIHSHADSLSVLMYANGRELLADKGHTTYDSSNEGYDLHDRSYTHNTIEVDGTGQLHPGSSGQTVATGYDGTADNIRQYTNGASSTIRAYTTSNTNAKHYRNVTWVKEYGGLLLVNDWVKSTNSSSHSCTQNWHTMPNSAPATSTSLGGFTANTWGYTNFTSGANMIIAQATPNNDGNNSITASIKTCADSNSSSGQSQYFEFAQSGKNVTFNTAIANYNGTSLGIRTMKMDTGVTDNVASAIQVQRFNNSTLSSLVDEISYYNSFESTPSERTIMRRLDSNNQYFMFKTNAGNAWYHVRRDETVDMLSLTNGSKLDTYLSSTSSSNEENPMARISTSAKVTDISAKYDVSTRVVSIETSDQKVINGTTAVTVEFFQFSGISAVKLNGETLEEGTDVTINGNTATVISFPSSNDKEYYYPAGYQFVKNIAVTYNGSGSSASTEIKEAVGGFVDEYSHMYTDSYHTHYDFTHNCSIITQDLAAGTGNGKYIYMGYSMTTNPADVNACTGVGVETTEYAGSDFIDTVTETVRGVCTTWYLCNNGGSDTYNPKMHSDGAVDLNVNAGGATIKTYATYDRNFGPAIDAIAVIEFDKGERITANDGNSPYCGAGWYTGVALNAPTNLPDLNKGAGGRTLYMYYHTPCVEVHSDTLRANLAALQEKYKNISTYTLTSPTTAATIQAAISTAQAIITDLGDGYTTYTQAQIDAAAAECVTQASRMTQIVTVTYNLNGSTGTKPEDKTFVFNTGSIVTATEPTKPSYVISYNVNGGSTVSTQTVYYTFAGWKSSVTGKILNAMTSVSSADLVGSTYTSPVTLTAQWTPTSATLPSTTKTGYTFGGWLCSADNQVKFAGSSYTPTANVTMTAQWTANTYSVHFNGNGATEGSMSNQSFTYGVSQELSANAFQRKYSVSYNPEGGTTVSNDTAVSSLAGWATSSDGEKVYNNKQSVSNLTSVKGGTVQLYAVWTLGSVALPESTRTGYTLEGWYKGSEKVGGAYSMFTPVEDTALNAVWTINKYSVKFYNYDGSVLQSGDWDYGTTPVYNGETPTKPSGLYFRYTFIGWDPEIVPATANASYTAVFESSSNAFTITWKNDDGTVLETDINTPYGSTPSYDGETPSKTATAQYTYTFSGWTPEISEVTEDKVYTAQYTATLNKYTVIWKNDDGTVLETDENVPFGTVPVYDGAAPQKESDAQYTYTFIGWTPDVEAVGGSVTYTALYSSVINTYTVTWKNDDGSILETDYNIPYGTMPSYDSNTPGKIPTAQYSYTFSGWNHAISAVTGDATYTAQFTRNVNKYTVIWQNPDGTVLQTNENVPYGETPSYDGAVPSKESNAQYTYTFIGWNPEISAVTGDTTYTAQYNCTVKKYTVTWKSDDSTVLETDENVLYGTVPAYNGATPQKAADAQFTYVFSGWTPDIASVCGDTVYTAQFSARLRSYTVIWKDSDGTNLQIDSQVPYGAMPSFEGTLPSKDADEQYIYTFSSWTPEIESVKGDITYTATYSTQLQKYSVSFIDSNGTVLQFESLSYGDMPRYNAGTPTKQFDDNCHYTFSGWSPEIESVNSDAVYAAQFDSEQHNLSYHSDGATHHAECSCGFRTEAQQHTPGADGKCTLCSADTTMFYINYGDITISENGASGYDADGNLISVGVMDSYTVTQLNPSKKADHCLNILSGSPTIIIDSINVERKGMTAYAISVQGTADVTFIIKGENHIKAGTYRAGLDIALDATATIEGDGTLYAVSPLQAGIGGGNGKPNGTLVINSGDIYATGGINGYSAGIGGGTSGTGGNITINGGYVVATGGTYGSGIGGGNGFGGGNITINGGTVTATGGKYAAGIGGGYTGEGGNIVINGGTVKATAGENAPAIGSGYKCTTTFAGIYNSDGDEVTLRIIDTGDAERVYFGGIDTAALRHHPDDDNYYFYACASSAVTAYSGDDVMFFIGEDLEQTDVYSASCVRKGDFLLTDDLDNIEASSAFMFYYGSMYYCSKRIDACEAGILGDVNLDGNADGEDSVLVNCIIVGLLTQADLEPIQYAAADYDFDGEITAADVTALEKAGLLGTVSTLNVEQDA